MKKGWKKYRLGDIVYQDKNSAVEVESTKSYEMVGVYSFGRGLFAKSPVDGINTSYKQFYQLKSNHIVLSILIMKKVII